MPYIAKDHEKAIALLENYGRTGRYREAFRYYLKIRNRALDASRSPFSSAEARLHFQYALALQHAGLFAIALEVYRNITQATMRAGKSFVEQTITAADVIYNARVHEAVLLERLGKPRRAASLLYKAGLAEIYMDANIARASLRSWVDITHMKCAVALAQPMKLKSLIRRCKGNGDWNQRLWAELYETLYPLIFHENISKASFDKLIRETRSIIDKMDLADPPASPWFSLISGQIIREYNAHKSIDILLEGHVRATALGKLFVIGAISEVLNLAYRSLRRKLESSHYLQRAMNAYARCGLLMIDPFSSRVYEQAEKLWGQKYAGDAILRSAHLLEPRESLVFSKMCNYHANIKKKRPDEIFEEFIRDWATYKYIGDYKHVESGRESIDCLVVYRGRAIAIQAKHVARPSQHIPKQLYLRNIVDTYGLKYIESYVLVLSTSSANGWQESYWHAQCTERVRQLVPDTSIKVEVVTEPELQTDVLLNDELFVKYFYPVMAKIK